MRIPRLGRLAVAMAVVAALGWMTSVAARAQEPLDANTYLERLTRADAVANRGMADPSPQLMDALVTTLGLPVEVAVGDRVVLVPADPVLSKLSGEIIADFAEAHARLTTLALEAELVLQADPPSERTTAAALHEAYEGIGARHPSWLERIRQRLSELLARALSNLTSFSGIETILEWLAVIAIMTVAVRLITKGRLVPDRRVRRKRPPRPQSVGDWLAKADRALSRGDVIGAVRVLYRALLAALASRGITADVPSLTAGECREAVGTERPSLYPLVARATEAYERVTYGMRSADREAIESLRRATLEARKA